VQLVVKEISERIVLKKTLKSASKVAVYSVSVQQFWRGGNFATESQSAAVCIAVMG
jgi:hypothetical protein